MRKTSRKRDNFKALWPQRPGKRIVALVLICFSAIHVVSARGMQDASRASALAPIQREIERQRQRLDSTEVEERRDALMRLGNLKRPDASRVAAKGLSDPIPIVRATAVHAIIHLQSEEAAALLVPLLRDSKEFVRQETAYALGETHSRSAVQPLIDALLGDKKNSVRGASAVALGQIGDEAAVVALSEVLAGGSSGDSGSKKAKKTVKVSGNEFVLRATARSLGQIRNRAAVPALVVALSNERNPAEVRREAAKALGLIGDRSARPALQAALTSSDPYLSQIAFDSLRQLAATKE
jgi:HEAT repeat protein